jgi:hypothetical protein
VKRSSWVLAGLALLTLSLIAGFLLLPGRRLPRDLLDAVPGDALGVAHVRVDRVLASPIYERLVVQRGQAQGIARLQKLCGFHPLKGLEEALIFALPAPGKERPRIAVLARGDIPHARLIRCIGSLGRSGYSDLVQEKIEGFDTVRSKNGTTRAAFIGSDGIVAGEAEAVRATIETLAGKHNSLGRDAVFAPLYRSLDARAELAGAARLAGSEALFENALKALALDAALVARLGVQSVAGSVRLETDALRLAGQVHTQNAAQAQQLAELGEALRRRALGFPALSLTGFAQPLRELSLRTEGAKTTLNATLPERALATALELLPALSALRRALQLAPAVSVADAGVDSAPVDDDEEPEP